MGNFATPAWLGGAAAAMALIALLAAAAGEAPDSPRQRPAGTHWMADVIDLSPGIVQAEVTAAAPRVAARPTRERMPFAAAPIGETGAKRTELQPRQQHSVALGRIASGMFGSGFEAGFERIAGCDLAFAPCPERDAVELVMVGKVDMALIGGSLSQREIHAGLRQTAVGFELFALAVTEDFPLRSLTRAQMRQVLTGEVGDWQRYGCDRGEIVVVVPSHKDLADRAASTLILGDSFARGAVRVPTDRFVADQLLRNPGAIAVVRVGATLPPGAKLLQIDWTPATPETFAQGSYPYGIALRLVTSGGPAGTARQLLDFAASEDGRELLGSALLPGDDLR